MTYGFLLESVWHPPLSFGKAQEENLPPELDLQALWFSGAFGREFRTTSGKTVRIEQFGEWNRSAGPDFLQTAVRIDGELLRGALELDLDSAAWESHGHGENPSFRDVVLHVVFRRDQRESFIRTIEHREVPQVLISRAQLSDALNRPLHEIAIAQPGRCLHPLKQFSPGGVERLLDEAAKHRARLKAARWLRNADAHGRNVALFHSTAETLGYRHNSLAMRLLAQRASLGKLHADPESAESILFGIAGFLSPHFHEQAPPETRDYLRNLWENWWKCRAQYEVSEKLAISWRSHGQRPANHPHRRVGALAALVAAWPQYCSLALARPFQAKPLVDFLQGLSHPFWDRHYTLGSAARKERLALFGRNHAMELIANHLAPLAIHEGGMTFPAYQKLRNSSPNEKVQRCSLRLFGSPEAAKPWNQRVYQHQALLQIYQDFCLEDFTECAFCPFPEQLLQWK